MSSPGRRSRADVVESSTNPVVIDIDENDDVDVDALSGNQASGPSSSNVPSASVKANGAEQDSNDEIVQEIPVFVSPAMSKKLHLIQYPLHQKESLSSEQPTTAKIKPRHCMLEVEYPTPDYLIEESEGTYHMPHRTFSSRVVPVCTHMALGKLLPLDKGARSSNNSRNNVGLHLVPLSRITQLRPSFAHVDEEQAADDELLQQQQQHQLDGDTTAAQALERKPVSFQKKESERAALARKSSYSFKKANEDAEIWHTLQVHNKESDPAQQIMDHIKCPCPNRKLLDSSKLLKQNRRPGERNITAPRSLNERYVNTLNYLSVPEQQDGKETELVVSTVANDQNNLSGIVTQLVKIMHQGWPIPYSILRAEFSDEINDDELLVALGSCSVLVRGNFCLASRLLALPPPIAKARTFILFLFQSMRVVHRERLEHAFASTPRKTPNGNKNALPLPPSQPLNDVTPAVIEMLLEQVGKKTSEGWVLKVDDDTSFSHKFPETVLVHVQHWAKQTKHYQTLLKKYREPMAARARFNDS